MAYEEMWDVHRRLKRLSDPLSQDFMTWPKNCDIRILVLNQLKLAITCLTKTKTIAARQLEATPECS